MPEELTNKISIQKIFVDASNITRMFRFGIKRNKLLITLDTPKLDKHFIFYLIELLELIEKDYIKN